MSNTNLFDSIIILSGNESHALWDLKAIKNYRPSFSKHFRMGEKVLDFLQTNQPDMILLDAELEDMPGVFFLHKLKERYPNNRVPVVMVTTENRRERVLDAIEAGCSGYILRPYSLMTFEKHMKRAHTMENFVGIERVQVEEAKELVRNEEFDEAIEAFAEVLNLDIGTPTIEDEAKKYYDMGCKYLLQNKFGQAIIAFRKAVKINDVFADAYQGIADAYQGKGDAEQATGFLSKAAEVHARLNHMHETKKLFIRILQLDENAANPFNTLGVQLRRKGDFEGALQAYRQAVQLTPNDPIVHFNLAKVQSYTGDTDDALESITMALKIRPDFPEAEELYTEITGMRWSMVRPTKEQAELDSLLDD